MRGRLGTMVWALVALGCNGDRDDKSPVDEADADADADADTDSDTDTDTEPVARVTPTNGTGLAVTADGAVAVVANRTAGEVTIVDLDLAADPPAGTLRTTFAEDGEPWAAVLSTDETAAFVILREAQEVLRIDDPRGNAAVSATRATTDSEPSGLAISPNGTTLYVANWGAGNVSVVDTATMATHAVDLNGPLLDAGVLGPGAVARPGLAHPYAIVVTDDGDGDDTDETVWVTEFYSQPDPGAVYADPSFFDTARQGLVWSFDAATETVAAPVALGSSADMGFTASDGSVAGCFPNQLYAVALDGTRLYVAGVCASPLGAGPPTVDADAAYRTRMTTVLYVVDTTTGREIEAERLLLNRAMHDLFESTGEPDNTKRRMPLLVQSLAFVPGTHELLLASRSADAVFRVEFDDAGAVADLGFQFTGYAHLDETLLVGRVPYGIAAVSPTHAVTVNEYTRNLSVLEFVEESVVAVVPCATPAPPEDLDLEVGRFIFASGLSRYSLLGQGWVSCEACHPHGGSDGVTWYLSSGPRQTPALDGTFAPDGTQRLLHWIPYMDEISDLESMVRTIGGGVGALVHDNSGIVSNADRIIIDGGPVVSPQIATDRPQAALNGTSGQVINPGVPGHDADGYPVTAQSVLPDWLRVAAYLETVRAPRAPALDAAAVARGEALFLSAGCNGCHGGPSWTISERFYVPSQTTNDVVGGTLSTDTYTSGNLPVGLNPPADLYGGTATLRANGSIQCVLRSVGTFTIGSTDGVAPPGVTVVETADDMVGTALGALGFNPPSLSSVGSGAPYFHAGNARTLEEVFDPTFAAHTSALGAFAPTPAEVSDLVSFLLSIDDTAASLSTAVGAIDTVLCP